MLILIASGAEADQIWERNEVDWIELPAGSKWVDREGVDSSPGLIKRSFSQDIIFDIGFMAGSYVNPDQKDSYQWRKDHAWYREQYSKHGHIMCIALARAEKTLIVSFPNFSTNFSIRRVKDGHIEKFIKIVSTYDPIRYRNRERRKPNKN